MQDLVMVLVQVTTHNQLVNKPYFKLLYYSNICVQFLRYIRVTFKDIGVASSIEPQV